MINVLFVAMNWASLGVFLEPKTKKPRLVGSPNWWNFNGRRSAHNNQNEAGISYMYFMHVDFGPRDSAPNLVSVPGCIYCIVALCYGSDLSGRNRQASAFSTHNTRYPGPHPLLYRIGTE